MQAGLPPDMDGRFYIDLTRTVKTVVPQVHIHAFSPEEVLYGSTRSGISIREYLAELKAAGLGSLPGTSAEILDQEIRDVISPGRITVGQWIEVITTAHSLGIPTTSTIMGPGLRYRQSTILHESRNPGYGCGRYASRSDRPRRAGLLRFRQLGSTHR